MLGYFHGLSQDEAHELVLSLFLQEASETGITRAFLARRLGKSPEQITRWLGAPGNWTLETLTNLLLAMGYKPEFKAQKLSDLRQSNEHHPSVSTALQIPEITLHPATEREAKIPAIRSGSKVGKPIFAGV